MRLNGFFSRFSPAGKEEAVQAWGGLAVVHSIVTGSGGTILVDSTLGVGTGFSVLLPKSSDPQTTLEGELCQMEGENVHRYFYGHVKGSFTGAHNDSRGLRPPVFCLAHAGCIKQCQ